LSPHLLDTIAPDPISAFTHDLNLDTSILVALVSDFCHENMAMEPWFSQSHCAHWAKEKHHKMLNELLPALAGHPLVCTEEAYQTFRHIVTTIGTRNELLRADIIFGLNRPASLDHNLQYSSADLISALQRTSKDSITLSLCLPIRPVTLTPELESVVPTVAKEILAHNPDMLQPGLSVFTYGLAKKLTTVTANHVAARTLGRDLDMDGRLTSDSDWPKVWVTSESRPLVGVPKSRRTRRHAQACEERCVCGIDRFHGGKTYEPNVDSVSQSLTTRPG